MTTYKPVLTIITPAYNRSDLLRDCFESLKNQSDDHFEWIVVDDGSTDRTEEMMQGILQEDIPFSVRYIKKENGGKHTALNASHPYIHGDYVLILDSDDILTENAVEEALAGWDKYKDDDSIVIVSFLKKTDKGQICAYAENEGVPTDVLHYRRRCLVSNDCCEVIRTETFKRYPFPVFRGERFLAETALWYRAGLEGSCVYINKPIYICQYLDDGLTKNGRKLRVSNPKGGIYTSYLRMNRRCRITERIRAAILFVCYGRFASLSFPLIVRRAKPYYVLVGICSLPGELLYLLWKKNKE